MKILIGLQSFKRLLSVRVIKVALAMFIFMSMMANIFIPRNIENKEQIVSVIRVVFDNVIVKTIIGCRDTLIAMSNELTRELYKLLMLGDVGTDVPVKREQEKIRKQGGITQSLKIQVSEGEKTISLGVWVDTQKQKILKH